MIQTMAPPAVATTTVTITARSDTAYELLLAGIEKEMLRNASGQCQSGRGTSYAGYDWPLGALVENRAHRFGGTISFRIDWFNLDEYNKLKGHWDSASHRRRFAAYGIFPEDIKVANAVL